jgi:NAD dependent epimerase/dehydratase
VEGEVKDQSVLVTGAGGFIGSHLAERLVQLGAKTRALVHYRGNGSWGWLDDSPVRSEMQIVAGDVRDRDLVVEAMKGVSVVFHLAALIGIPYSYHAPASYVDTNIGGTLNVLQAARDVGVQRVVHTSTSEVYGTAQYVPIDESHPLHAQSPYAATKIGADKLAESFHLSYGLPVVTIRPFNTFGPRQSERAVIPTIIAQLLTGETIRLGNLTPTRDLNYVSNTVDGFIMAASAEAAAGRTMNIGSGREISIRELVDVIGRLTGRQPRIEVDPERERPGTSEVERLLANASLARQTMGWEPRVSLEDGLQLTIDFIRHHLSRYRSGSYAR